MFLSPIFAEAAPAAGGSSISMIVMLVAFIAIFYFMIYRPQKKQEKETKNMRDNLQIGDEISTNGGILGRIVKIKDDIVTIETGSDKGKLKIFKWAIRAVEIPANSDNEE
jgi:preprotein translocase subunit YajC